MINDDRDHNVVVVDDDDNDIDDNNNDGYDCNCAFNYGYI